MSDFSTQQDAAYRIVQEGLAYAVQDYRSPKTFSADPALEELWYDAALACNELESYLAPEELNDRTKDIKRLKEGK